VANWLRILLIIVAILLGTINVVFFCLGNSVRLPPDSVALDVRARYALGGATYSDDKTVVEKQIHQLLDESRISATVAGLWRGSPSEGWWVSITLPGVDSESQAELVWFKVSDAIVERFGVNDSEGQGLTMIGEAPSVDPQAMSSMWRVLLVGNLLLAVMGVILLAKLRPSSKASPIQTDAGS